MRNASSLLHDPDVQAVGITASPECTAVEETDQLSGGEVGNPFPVTIIIGGRAGLVRIPLSSSC